MQPEPKVQKKKKNPGWNSQPSQQKQQQSNHQKVDHPHIEHHITKKFQTSKPLTQLAKKYQIDTSRQLGHGFASVVYPGVDLQTNEDVCIKIIDYMVLGGSISLLQSQVELLNKLDSEHIVKLYDIYQSHSFCYLVMEICPGGDLFKFIFKRQEILNENQSKFFIKNICMGLQQLKKNGLIHRDLKTQNIFIGKQACLKIGDLGFCTTESNPDKMNVGSPIYMSPQVALNQNYSFASDIYGLGVIWYELLFKKAPWKAQTQQQLIQMKTTQKVPFEREDISEQTRNIILKCLNIDPKQRCTIQEIIQFLNKQQSKPKQKHQQPEQQIKESSQEQQKIKQVDSEQKNANEKKQSNKQPEQ